MRKQDKMIGKSLFKPTQWRHNALTGALILTGYAFGAPYYNFTAVLGSLAICLAMILLFNAVSEFSLYDTGHPDLKPLLANFLLAFAVAIFWFPTGTTFGFLILIALLQYFYLVHALNTPVLSTIIFFLYSLFCFVFGYSAAYEINVNAFLFGIYFALVFAGGQLIGDICKLHSDQALHQESNVTRFGAETVFRFSYLLFGLAFALMFIMSQARFLRFSFAAPFMIAFAIQTLFYLRAKREVDVNKALMYQFIYRLLYILAAVVFAGIRFFG